MTPLETRQGTSVLVVGGGGRAEAGSVNERERMVAEGGKSRWVCSGKEADR